VAYGRDEVEEDLIPPTDATGRVEHYHLWVKLADFEARSHDDLLDLLDPERPERRGALVALGNQTNPLFCFTLQHLIFSDAKLPQMQERTRRRNTVTRQA
jgi:hypothetical protein